MEQATVQPLGGRPAAAPLPAPASCPVHGDQLCCPTCLATERGRRGGALTSQRKRDAVRRNLLLANEAKAAKARGRCEG